MRRALPLLALTGAALLALSACAGAPSGNPKPPEPAKPVELGKYLGLWYEAARYDFRFEKGCDGVTAEYSLRPDGLVEVRNTCRKGGPEGVEKVSLGKAKVVDKTAGAKLKVSFFGPFFVGDYWVMDHADDYSWAIVGEGSGRYLWLLTRDKPTPALTQALTDRAKAMGYDVSRLRVTRHARG